MQPLLQLNGCKPRFDPTSPAAKWLQALVNDATSPAAKWLQALVYDATSPAAKWLQALV
jgi:hypothetical protein